MALYKRGTRFWARFSNGRTAPKDRIPLHTSDEAEANRLHDELVAARKRAAQVIRNAPAQTSATLAGAWDTAETRYFSELRSRRTAGFHRKAVFAVLKADIRLHEVTSDSYDAIKIAERAKGNANATINKCIGTLRQVMGLAREYKLWSGDVPKWTELPEPKGRIRIYSAQEGADILEHFALTNRPEMVDLTVLLLDTGLRLGEALAYDKIEHRGDAVRVWGSTVEVKGADRRKVTTKNGDERTVPLTARASAALKRHLAAPKITKDAAHYRWNTMRDSLGHKDDDEFVIHVCRHTCATRLLSAGMDVRKVQVWLGHKDIQSTLRYTKVLARDLQAGARALEQLTQGTP
jgi:integrase